MTAPVTISTSDIVGKRFDPRMEENLVIPAELVLVYIPKPTNAQPATNITELNRNMEYLMKLPTPRRLILIVYFPVARIYFM